MDEEKLEVPNYHVLDGGSLIHRFPWKRGTTFDKIVKTYLNYVKTFNNPTVAFDGYKSSSTKDITHQRRSNGAVGQKMLFTGNMTLRTKKEIFLSNPENKQNFIDVLCTKLEDNNVRTLKASDDADLLIAQKVLEHLPFVHTIAWCDTTSRLFGIGKGVPLKKIKDDTEFGKQAEVFSKQSTKEEVKVAGENALLCLYGGGVKNTLDSLRMRKYRNMVIKSLSNVQIQKLPPTPDAAKLLGVWCHHINQLTMPKKCGVVNCNGNYTAANKCRVFRLPNEESERQKWLNVIPPRRNFVIDHSKFYVICEKHWPQDAPMKKVPGGVTRPTCPPSIFDVPSSCMPTPKPAPRPAKNEDKQLYYFLKKDKIGSFADFAPSKELEKKYQNMLISKTENEFVCVFMTPDFKESFLSIIVHNKQTMCAPLTLSAFKNGINVPLAKILGPNNGLSSYSQFFEAINCALNYYPTLDNVLDKVVMYLQAFKFECIDADKARRLHFIIRQLELLTLKCLNYGFHMKKLFQCIICQLTSSFKYTKSFNVLLSPAPEILVR
ncbi:hypothetical protein GQR58_009762 [Nymphon striatum]|nr:hypothetical protein GQR58_009762 [Nymphon striatum]